MTVIILDIDGVLSPDPDTLEQAPKGYTLHSYGEAKALLNRQTQIGWLSYLINTHTVVWGSKREEHSNLILAMLGLKHSLPHIPIDGNDVGMGTWKLKSIRKWVEENVPADEKVIWVEDELLPDAYNWASTRGNTYLVAPALEVGLTVEDMAHIKTLAGNKHE